MEPNRKWGIIGSLFLITFIGLLLFLQYLINSKYVIWPGIPCGIGLSLIVVAYLHLTWDPANLRPVNPNARTAPWNWMLPVVIASVIVVRISASFLDQEVVAFLGSCLLTSGIVIFSYLTIQLWRHRPR
jgi:hypothetical protein